MTDDRDLAQVRETGVKLGPREPEPPQRRGPARRQQQIRPPQPPVQRSAVLPVLQVETHDLLSGGQVLVVAGAHPGQRVPARRLDLGHGSPHSAKPGRRRRTRQVHGQREDPYAPERRGPAIPLPTPCSHTDDYLPWAVPSSRAERGGSTPANLPGRDPRPLRLCPLFVISSYQSSCCVPYSLAFALTFGRPHPVPAVPAGLPR